MCIGVLALGLSFATPGYAQEKPYSLSSDFPLRVEDATPTRHGKVELEFQTLYEHQHSGTDRTTLQPEIKWGFAPDFDLHIQSPIYVGDGDRSGSGDVQVNAQWNFLKDSEKTWWPAMAIEGQLDIPSGKDSEGLDTRLQFIATKTLSGQPAQDQLHVNFTWVHNAENAPVERDDRYIAVLGYSRRLVKGTVLVADFVWEQQAEEDMESNIVEIGIIQDLSENVKLAFGIGTGIGDESPDIVGSFGIRFSF